VEEFQARLRSPGALLFGAVLLALLALAGAALGATALGDRQRSAPLLALALRSLLWLGLAWWLRSPREAAGATTRDLLLLALGLGLASGASGGVISQLAAGSLPAGLSLRPDPAALGAGWLALLAVTALVLAPLAEELLFRGVLYRSLRERWGARVALVGSAGAFALFHLEPVQLIVAAIAGLALGWLRQRGGLLWPCVLAHAAHNLVWLVGALVGGAG